MAHQLSDAFKNAHGQLHKQIKVKQGAKIPKAKLLAAVKGKYGPKAKQRALPVLNMQGARQS